MRGILTLARSASVDRLAVVTDRSPLLAAALFMAACSGGEDGPPEPMIVEVGPFELAAGEETSSTCFSQTFDNDETIYISSVAMNASFGFHHSNWFFVPESVYAGADGVWDCDERNFETAIAAVRGGVLFAQSTQATAEVQAFEPGAVLAIPPGSKIVSQLHMLNASTEPLIAQSELVVTAIGESEVKKRLAPIYLQYEPLTIPPRQDSRFVTDCELDAPYRGVLGRELDIDIHYILPHYHGLGMGITVDIVGGPRDGENVFANSQRIGEPLGRRFDPPIDLSGATGIRFGCEFSNPTDLEVGWGIGDQEMCILFGFAESELIIGGGVVDPDKSVYVGDVGGVAEHQGECVVLATRLAE